MYLGSGVSRTQEDRRAETRALLLDAAADLFAHKGFHATSAEAVASAADRTTGALYDHFGGKNGLLVALLERWIEETIVGVTASFADQDLDGQLGSLWDSIVASERDSGDAWLLLEFELWLHAVRDPELGVVGAERFNQMRAGLAVGVSDWSKDFGLDLPASPEEISGQLIALLIGSAFQFRLDPSSFSKQSVVRSLQRLMGVADTDPTIQDSTPNKTPSR
ncbi:MAG TPA: TetR/AcrR family transcriptional regulator, partial [Microthrixaceae bacterium]|nr:TetR/AcrR family transcriptional regulator [Microthrixaceae bacterium]